MIESNTDTRLRMLWILLQNCRITVTIEIGKDLRRLPSPTLWSKQNQLSRILSSKILNVSKILHNLFWKHAPESDHPYKEKKGFFLHLNGNSCVSICPVSLVLSLDTNEKNLVPSSLFTPIRYLDTLIRSPLSLLQAEQFQLSQPLSICQIH